MKQLYVLTFTLVLVFCPGALALDQDGNDPSGLTLSELRSERNLQVLYTFDNTSGPVIDRSGNATQIDLTVGPGVSRSAGELDINTPTLIFSGGSTSRLVDACKATNEMTVEMWVKSDTQGQLDIISRKIITMSNDHTDGNFHVSQDYDNGSVYTMGVKVGNNRNNDSVIAGMDDPTPRQFDLSLTDGVHRADLWHHIFFTVDTKGVAKAYVSDANGISIERFSDGDFTGGFQNWDDSMTIGLGNEVNYTDPVSEDNPALTGDDVDVAENIRNNGGTASRDWLGSYSMVAVYCKALTKNEILGPRAPRTLASVIPLDLGVQVTPARLRALTLYRRLVGMTTPMYDSILGDMEVHLQSYDPVENIKAAQIATTRNGFYNRTVVDFAKSMSTRDETPRTPLNDFAATVVGMVVNDDDATEMTTANYLYEGEMSLTAVRRDPLEDILGSNNHYLDLEEQGYDLSTVLVKNSGQKIAYGSGDVQSHPDPAGLITSRAFMAAHAVAGTNRRPVEYTFREFLCQPINLWADNQASDAMVGRDVERKPGGLVDKYTSTCKSCHAVMDSLRPAFGQLNYNEDRMLVQHGDAQPEDDDNFPDNTGIVAKMNQNEEVFPKGYPMNTTFWKNYAIAGTNASYFGWRDTGDALIDGTQLSNTPTGTSLQAFGQMITRADAFPRCMAKRVFKSVCKREVETFDNDMIVRVADQFKQDGYNLKLLFERIAVQKECIGQ